MENLAREINGEIKNSFVYKEYLKLREKVDNDEYLTSLKEELESMKKIICKEKNEDLLNDYYEKEKIYKSNQLVKEYLRSKDAVEVLLKDIVDILSLN